MLHSLGHIAVTTGELDAWEDFSKNILGMQVTDRGDRGFLLRVDDRAGRIFVEAGRREEVSAIGWDVADNDALETLAVRLSNAGHRVRQGTSVEVERRRVAKMIVTHDPIGNRLEFCCGATRAPVPFTPGRAISGFRTGPLGLGHAVLTVRSLDAVLPFYRDLLGFRLSDYALHPFKAFFFHLNSRHHSLALIETGVDGFHHLMVELGSLDDVGQGYDLAQLDPGGVAVTLGRHSNDYMTSFYARTPSRFMIEYGWGGRSIDPATWQPFECVHGPSLWGHERSWLDEEGRAEARRLRLDAAAEGVRAPDFVKSGD